MQGISLLYCVQTGSRRYFLIIWVLEALYPGDKKRSGREADHSPSSNAEVKNYMFIPAYLLTARCLTKHSVILYHDTSKIFEQT
jgi:hypothetical protein